jgi:hypothetical protein
LEKWIGTNPTKSPDFLTNQQLISSDIPTQTTAGKRAEGATRFVFTLRKV